MKRSAISVLVFALAQIVIQPRATGMGIPARFTGGANPQCWVASAHLKNIDSHLPNPSASYVIQGRCETYGQYISFDKPKKNESTFETGPVDSQINWTAQGTYQPVEKNTWEDITLTQRQNGKAPTSGVLTGWMLCGKDPWLKGDPSACGAPGFKTSGVVDPALAELYKQILAIPLTAHLTSSQRQTLNNEYQAAVQAATKKAQAVKVVAISSINYASPDTFAILPAVTTVVAPGANQTFVERTPIPIKVTSPKSLNAAAYMVNIEVKNPNGTWSAQVTIPVGVAQAQSAAGFTGFGNGPPPGYLALPGSYRINAQVSSPKQSALSAWVAFSVKAK